MNRWIRMFRLWPILPPLVMLAACAGNRAVGVGSSHTDLTVLTQRQISHYQSAMGAVQTMRPQWLRGRSPGDLIRGAGTVLVYRDGMPVGTTDVLKYMSTEGIAYIRFYDGIYASWRWGLGHENGVIFVSSQVGLDPGGHP